MKKSYQVLVWGGYCFDLIFTGLEEFPRPGEEVYSPGFSAHPGGCFTTVLALKRLGVRAGWACDFGDDPFSNLVLESARHEGFDESLFRYHNFPLRRVTAAVSSQRERAFLSYADPLEAPAPGPILGQMQSEWLLLSHLYYGDESLPLLQAARKSGMRIFMDCQSISTSLKERPEIAQALRLVDAFSPNEAEALRLTGEKQVEAALERLAELTPRVVIKLGSRGALAREAEKTYAVPGIRVERVVDTSGAGDCFDAGFLYAELRGYGMEESLRIANICGGLSVQDAGGKCAPDEEQVLRWFSAAGGK